MLKLNSFTVTDEKTPPTQVMRRRATLSHKYELFYRDPINPVQAQDAWITDASGRKYLDAYNNVVSVGHGNRRVIDAMTNQAKIICTHTRYVNDELCRLSERLTGKNEGNNEWRSIFTCSGSEANDLAMRVAMQFTGGNGFIVTDHAYHGLTALTQAITTSMTGYLELSNRLGLEIATIPSPVGKNEGNSFIDGLQTAINDMHSRGIRLAAGIFDSFFTSDGLGLTPKGFLDDAVRLLHDNGALYIADEVQPGFARSGSYFWGFQTHGADPDIITMGKPMGNGYPMAAIMFKALLDDYIMDSYFNTFGGNNVAVAVGHAVLDEIEERNLLENAHIQGKKILSELEQLKESCVNISSVRGSGMSIAVDVVTNDGAPNADGAIRIVEAMKQRGVIISTSGVSGNTLKIRPLLIYTNEDTNFLIDQAQSAVRTVFS